MTQHFMKETYVMLLHIIQLKKLQYLAHVHSRIFRSNQKSKNRANIIFLVTGVISRILKDIERPNRVIISFLANFLDFKMYYCNISSNIPITR